MDSPPGRQCIEPGDPLDLADIRNTATTHPQPEPKEDPPRQGEVDETDQPETKGCPRVSESDETDGPYRGVHPSKGRAGGP